MAPQLLFSLLDKKLPARLNISKQPSKLGAGNRQATTFSQNALAGGLAGCLVSCFVYPVDTIKTIIQASRKKQLGPLPALASALHQKGILDLYKGLGASLATSAPISALYASTYESVKEFLIPRLPKDWIMVAHCVAGGAASVATSSIYTPSEVVKQRLQLGSEYKTSISAFVGILRNEGVASLYSGLGAVLCRNVPQSVIKFLTYETLKKMALERQITNKERLHPVSQLVIGGLAGSTAAAFTTPFDVVKTRMQAKVVGSVQYGNVADALCSIWRQEGLGGLYRGLAPRLLIYMSQGAIFFASYEVLKVVLRASYTRVTVSGDARPAAESQEN